MFSNNPSTSATNQPQHHHRQQPQPAQPQPRATLNLRMKTKRSCMRPDAASSHVIDHENEQEKLRVMLRQDRSTYRCEDYLTRRASPGRCRPHKFAEEHKLDAAHCADQEDPVDAICREKMCEWSYRVTDHYQCGREIVAVAMSYLDRFIDKCSCDRTAFKLAAMTTLYMATKVFNSKQISIKSLSDLSRGEFECSHISEMERIILEKLEWRMHPPTPQSFIMSLLDQLPISNESDLGSILYQRAIFFAELALYDYAFVPMQRSVIAVAAIANAMEGIDDSIISQEYQDSFLESVTEQHGYRADDIVHTRDRLWQVYAMSAQHIIDEPSAAIMSQHPQQHQKHGKHQQQRRGGHASSPSAGFGANSKGSRRQPTAFQHSPVSVATGGHN